MRELCLVEELGSQSVESWRRYGATLVRVHRDPGRVHHEEKGLGQNDELHLRQVQSSARIESQQGVLLSVLFLN